MYRYIDRTVSNRGTPSIGDTGWEYWRYWEVLAPSSIPGVPRWLQKMQHAKTSAVDDVLTIVEV